MGGPRAKLCWGKEVECELKETCAKLHRIGNAKSILGPGRTNLDMIRDRSSGREPESESSSNDVLNLTSLMQPMRF